MNIDIDTEAPRVAILATDYFEESELFSPLEALERAGADVEVIAPKSGRLKSLRHVEPGKAIEVDKTLEEADPDDYDGLVVPGGAVNADFLRTEERARRFIRRIMDEGKPTAVICHGPWLLASAGLARDRHLTSFFTIQDDMRNAGAEWEDREVIEDGNLITSRSPDDLPAFNSRLLAALGLHAQAAA